MSCTECGAITPANWDLCAVCKSLDVVEDFDDYITPMVPNGKVTLNVEKEIKDLKEEIAKLKSGKKVFIYEELELIDGCWGYHRTHIAHNTKEKDWSKPFRKTGDTHYISRIVAVYLPPTDYEALKKGWGRSFDPLEGCDCYTCNEWREYDKKCKSS